MNEKQKAKLLKLLAKWHVSPEEAQAFLDDYDSEPDELEEVAVDEELSTEDAPAEEADNVEAPADNELAETDEVPTEESVDEVVEEASEPEVDTPIDEPTDEPSDEEAPADLPTTEPAPVEETPLEDNASEVAILEQKIDALNEVVDSLKAQNSALLTNLKEAGLIDIAGETPIEVGKNENIADSGTSAESRSESVIRALNR